MTDRVIKYLRAQRGEADTRLEAQGLSSESRAHLEGFQRGLDVAIRTLETGDVHIFSAGSTEFYAEEEE